MLSLSICIPGGRKLWPVSHSLPLVFINKVLLEIAVVNHLDIVYGNFCAIVAEMSSSNRDCMSYKDKYLLSGPL